MERLNGSSSNAVMFAASVPVAPIMAAPKIDADTATAAKTTTRKRSTKSTE